MRRNYAGTRWRQDCCPHFSLSAVTSSDHTVLYFGPHFPPSVRCLCSSWDRILTAVVSVPHFTDTAFPTVSLQLLLTLPSPHPRGPCVFKPVKAPSSKGQTPGGTKPLGLSLILAGQRWRLTLWAHPGGSPSDGSPEPVPVSAPSGPPRSGH